MGFVFLVLEGWSFAHVYLIFPSLSQTFPSKRPLPLRRKASRCWTSCRTWTSFSSKIGSSASAGSDGGVGAQRMRWRAPGSEVWKKEEDEKGWGEMDGIWMKVGEENARGIRPTLS